MFAGAFHAGGEPQHLRAGDSLSGDHSDDLRLAFGQRARLVDDQRVDALHALERFGVLDEDAHVSAAPDANHDRHRSGQTQRAGTRDDEDADGGDEAERETWLGTVESVDDHFRRAEFLPVGGHVDRLALLAIGLVHEFLLRLGHHRLAMRQRVAEPPHGAD